MSGINKVILLGALGKDPEQNIRSESFRVTKFSVATSESYKDKSGVKQETTEWHNVEAYNQLSDIVLNYFKKGEGIYIEGKIKTEEWEKDGVKNKITKIIADKVSFLPGSKKTNTNGSTTTSETTKTTPATSSNGSSKAETQADTYMKSEEFVATMNQEEDDLPF